MQQDSREDFEMISSQRRGKKGNNADDGRKTFASVPSSDRSNDATETQEMRTLPNLVKTTIRLA
jgi:hypothetical protein